MAESRSISQLTVNDAVKIINDIVVNAIIDLDFKVEELTKVGFILDIKGLKFRFLYITNLGGSLNIWQFNYSNNIEIAVFKLSYDNEIIHPILNDIIVNGMREIKVKALAELRSKQAELELELA